MRKYRKRRIINIFYHDSSLGADKPVKKPTIEEQALEKYKQEKMDWDLYQGVLNRDQELHTLRSDM